MLRGSWSNGQSIAAELAARNWRRLNGRLWERMECDIAAFD
jgi:hypothetical protein